jgi:hypothetical protein
MSSLPDHQSYRAGSTARLSDSGYFWVALAFFVVAMVACAVPGSTYAPPVRAEMPVVGP